MEIRHMQKKCWENKDRYLRFFTESFGESFPVHLKKDGGM